MAEPAKKVMLTSAWTVPSRVPPKHTNTLGWTLVGPGVQGTSEMQVALTEMGPGGASEMTTHPVAHIYYVISGRAKARAAGEEFDLVPGSCLYMAAEVEHDVRVVGDETLRFLVVFAPAPQPR